MKTVAMRYVAPAVCVAAAALLLYADKEGWGWFLFVAVLLA